MVKLPNGKVLYAGGYNSSNTFLSTCKLFDPATSTWGTTGSMATARAQHGLILLNSGLVLAIGGNDGSGNALASCELYDPAMGTWSSTGSMGTARTRFANYLLSDHTVLVAGGAANTGGTSPRSSSEIYSAGTWSATGSLSAGAFGPLFGILGDGRPFITGGVGAGTATATFASGTWTSRAASVVSYYCNDTNPTATLPSGDIICINPEQPLGHGGDPVYTQIYRQLTNTWSTITGPSEAHAGSTYVLNDGSILIAGGLQVNVGSQLSSNKTDLFDPNTETFTQVGNLPYSGELTATGSMRISPVLDDGSPLWACPEINGGSIPTSNSSLVFGETPSMAITRIQTFHNDLNTVDLTTDPGATFTAGSLVVVAIAYNGLGITITGVSDGTSTYVVAPNSFFGSGVTGANTAIYYAKNVTAVATPTITVSLSGGGATHVNIAVLEYSGADTTAPVDDSNSLETISGSTPYVSPTLTLSQTGDVMVSMWSSQSGNLATPTPGTNTIVTTDTARISTEDFPATSGAYHDGFSETENIAYQVSSAAFKTPFVPPSTKRWSTNCVI